jgi:hypothetical protein
VLQSDETYFLYFSSYGTGVSSILTGIAARITTQSQLDEVGIFLLSYVKQESSQAVTLFTHLLGVCSSIVVEVVCYKPEGRGFKTR